MESEIDRIARTDGLGDAYVPRDHEDPRGIADAHGAMIFGRIDAEELSQYAVIVDFQPCDVFPIDPNDYHLFLSPTPYPPCAKDLSFLEIL